ncbi:MAG: hypothetical protein GY868_13000 [Deltaproteobacteria bacterium]|nr:hypothetical protein [Deltaproteobacteria bacterium]
MTSSELKQYIRQQCGDPAVGITSVDDFNAEEVAALQGLNRTMAAYTPMYDPDSLVFQPGDFLDNGQAIIVLGFNMYFGRRSGLPGSPPRSEIMNFYVNPECLAYIAGQLEKVTAFLADKGFNAASLASGIPLKILAARSGMGRYGKNGVIQAPRLGSWLGLTGVITDAPLEFDAPLEDACGTCSLCREACPTGALDEPYKCDITKCLTLHMVNNKGEIPRDIKEKAGTCLAHCNICLDVCPRNNKLEVQTEISNPEDSVYPEVAPLVTMTDAQFEEMFSGTFLEFMFMDKKYLQRNAAIVLGNIGDPAYVPILAEALVSQPEELVRTDAAWALGRIGTDEARAVLEKHLQQEVSAMVRDEITCALERPA